MLLVLLGQLSQHLQGHLRDAFLHQVNNAAVSHISQDGGVAMPPCGGLFRQAKDRWGLQLPAQQAAFHRPAHHSVVRIPRDPGRAYRSPNRASLLEQGEHLGLEAQSEAACGN